MKKYLILLFLIMGTNMCMGSDVTSNVEEITDIPEVIMSSEDEFSTEEMEEDFIEMKIPEEKKEILVPKEKSVISTNDSNSGTTSDDNKSLRTINNFHLFFGAPYLKYKVLHGSVVNDLKYLIGVNRRSQAYGKSRTNKVDEDQITGSLSTPMFDDTLDSALSYKRYQSNIPDNNQYDIDKSNISAKFSTNLKLIDDEPVNIKGEISHFSQTISANSDYSQDMGVTIRYKTYKYSDSLLDSTLKVGRNNVYKSGYNYLIAGFTYDIKMESDAKLSLGLELPNYWQGSDSFNQLSPKIKYSKDLNKWLDLWCQISSSLEFPSDESLLMNDPYIENASDINPQRTSLAFVLGFDTKNIEEYNARLKFSAINVKDQIIGYDLDNNNLIEYHNGKELFFLMVDAGLEYFVNDKLRLDSQVILDNSSIDDNTPYHPKMKLNVSGIYDFDKTSSARLKYNYVSSQYTSYVGGAIKPYSLLGFEYEKQLARDIKGYFLIDNIFDQGYSLYKNIPGQPTTIIGGVSLTL